MTRVVRLISQLLLYGTFAVLLAYLSVRPTYQYAAPDTAVLKMALSHATERIVPCVQLTPEEIAAQSDSRPAMCERGRWPLTIELEIDGVSIASFSAQPSGIWRDGPASVYERYDVAPGRHRVSARIRDTGREQGWDYTFSDEVDFVAGRYSTLTFRAETGGFSFR